MCNIFYLLPERSRVMTAPSILTYLLLFSLNLSGADLSHNSMLSDFPKDRLGPKEDLKTGHKNQQYRFKNITTKDGLSFYRVRVITQDKYGFMWLGADNGIDRFDGKNFTPFRHKASDPNSLPSNDVSYLLTNENEDVIWVGTRDGFCFIDAKTLKVTRIDLGPYKDIRTLYQDSRKYLWIGTHKGLIKLDLTTFSYSIFNKSNSNISHNLIRSIYKDQSGNLWVGTQDKLNVQEKGSADFKSFDLKGNSEQPIQNNLILTITHFSKNSDSLLWIGTETGLCLFNRYTEKYKVYRKKQGEILSNDKIVSIHQADSNKIWIGTDFGLNLFNVNNEKTEIFYHNPTDPSSLSNNKIWSIFEDRAGLVWFATDNGVNIWNKNQKPFIFFPVNYKLKGRSVGSQINDIILADEPNNFWLATQQGIIKYSSTTGITTTFNYQPNNHLSLLAAKTLDLYLDEYKNLWIATNKGVNVFDQKKNKMFSFPAIFTPGPGLKSQFINSLIKAKNGSLWVGTWDGGLHKTTGDPGNLNTINFTPINEVNSSLFVSGQTALWIVDERNGLYRMDLLTHKIIAIETLNEVLHDKIITSIIYSNKGALWLGTQNGLLEYNINKNQVDFFPLMSGKNVNIISLLEDDLGNIWCGSFSNLIKFGIDSHQFEIYPIGKDMPIKGLLPGSCCKSNNGELVFAGQDGFIVFDPEEITKCVYQPEIVISELYIQNERINPGQMSKGKNILKNSIFYEKEIILEYKQRSLMLRFASLHYGDPSGNIFTYKLEDYDPEWQYTSGDKSFAVYSNLPSGRYNLRLRGTNNDGVWSRNETSLLIKIKPPPWASLKFILLYFFVFLLLLSLIFYFYYMKIQWLNRLQNIRIEKKRNEEIAITKQRFFTNISHEFRTPLSLIIGPTNEILRKDTIDKESRTLLQLISKNAQRLLRLVDQVLEFRKLEINNVKFQESSHEIIEFCYQIYDMFTDQAERKGIKYSFRSNVDRLESMIDPSKMETILFNLLSNAIKYTPREGEISIEVDVQREDLNNFPEGNFRIRIKDSGIGISREDQNKVFNRFYQCENEGEMAKGSGIGLTIVKEYVEIHSGNITLESSLGAGSVFEVKIPIKTVDPLSDTSKEFQKDSEHIAVKMNKIQDSQEIKEKQLYLNNPLVLLVEDNPEVIDFIKISLEEKYRFMMAENGKIALPVIEKHVPDLIISDVMMPEMDGFDFCKSVKNNPKTSHIPIILLSARTLTDDQIVGIKSGADAYLTKPFDINYLDAVIQNLFSRKELLVEYARMQLILNPAEIEITSTDEKILKQVITFIESHISNPDLNVNNICLATGYTHSFLYRKIKHMTGGTLNELIRDIRIKRSAQLLKTRKFTIAEVMVEVGFSNHSYFSKCFRKVYKKSPGNYVSSLEK